MSTAKNMLSDRANNPNHNYRIDCHNYVQRKNDSNSNNNKNDDGDNNDENTITSPFV